MSDLAEFLLARIAEDESDARRIQTAYEADELHVPAALVNAGAVYVPNIVLRECDAKRRIVDLHALARSMGHQCVAIDGPTQHHMADPCATLRLLASSYAEHPDYREEWRP